MPPNSKKSNRELEEENTELKANIKRLNDDLSKAVRMNHEPQPQSNGQKIKLVLGDGTPHTGTLPELFTFLSQYKGKTIHILEIEML